MKSPFYSVSRLMKVVPLIILFVGTTVYATPLTQPVKDTVLPSGWELKPPTKKDGTQKIMNPVKTGQAVNVRIHTYDVPISAKAFIEEVRLKLAKKKDYEGAQLDLVATKTVKGKTWDVFGIRRKDEISQEIWARKPSRNVVFMIIYTGAGDYFSQYHKDLMSIIKKAS